MRVAFNNSGVRLTSVLLVAMLSLASARSFVPGMCATQAALDAQGESDSVVCCDHSARSDDSGQPVSPAKSDVECAFCKLATALVDTPNVLTLHVAAVPAIADERTLSSLALVDSIDQAHAGRAPPALLLA